MGWPTLEDYRAALQHPERAFREPRLQTCTPEVNRMGLPRGRAGGFAIVYRLSNGSWSTALRVFLNPPKPDRQARYQIVHKYLDDLAVKKARPRCLVDFKYDPEGILIGSRRFPIQTLEWVEGEQAGEWLKAAVARGDVRAIKQMADTWIELVGELRARRIAHGDLQHGNVLVVGERLVLVDYDGMYVATMRTDKDREAWEFGMPGYQHPGRVGRLLSADLDNFSAWTILIALRAMADDPGMWRRFIGATGNENLLFTREDIEAPARSALWPALIQGAKDRRVREWAERLRRSLDGPFEQVPPFDIDIFGPLRDVIAAGDWRQIQELATGRKYASKTFPSDLAPRVQEAIQRVECSHRLEQKIRGGRVREIAAAYRPELLDDWADAGVIAAARAAKTVVDILGELARSEQSDPSGKALVALWDRRGRELAALPEGDESRVKVEGWRQRIAATERLEQAVRRGGPEQAIAEAWTAVGALGGHRDAEAHRGRAELAARRLKALGALRGVPVGEDEAADRALLAAWDAAAQALDGCPEADPSRLRVGAARARLPHLAELKRRIDAADHGRGDERAVVAAADALPPGYGADFLQRVRKARERIAASEALDRALRGVPPSDLAIAAAAERARGDGSGPTDPAGVARCALSLRRRDLIRKLDAIPQVLPLDEQDAHWLVAWDEALLHDCHDARDHRIRYGRAVARSEALTDLERALSAGDAIAIKRLARDPRLADHPGLARRQDEIDAFLATSERIERLLAAARGGQAETFLAEVEPGLLAAHASAFLPYRERIEGWVDGRLRQGDVLRPASPPFLNGVAGASVTARWAWAQARLVRTCLVATDPVRFLDRPEEARDGTLRLDPDAHRRAQGGASLSLPPGCRKLYVTVWPVVDLGWARRTGPPLKVGPYVATAIGVAASRPWSERMRIWIERLFNS